MRPTVLRGLVRAKVGASTVSLVAAAITLTGRAPAQESPPYTAPPPSMPSPTIARPVAGPVGDVPASVPVIASPTPDEHEQFVRHLAIGYLGISSLPIAAAGVPGAPPTTGSVNAPVIGVRYWLSSRVGIDAGFGLGLLTGTQQPTSFGLAVHGGLPLAITHTAHYALEIIPELTTGFTTGTIETPLEPNASVGGALFRVGARAGAEIHFGFIGIPQLALQATIGLYYSYQHISWTQGPNASSGNSSVLTTSVDGAPWAIFTNSITALYYF